MIIIRLAGGLGNQIFQVAAGFLLAKRRNIKNIVIDDSNLTSYEAKRKNLLNSIFDFEISDFDIDFKKNFFVNLRLPKLFIFKNKINPFVSDRNFRYVLEFSRSNFFVLDGYFQDVLSAENFQEELYILNKIKKSVFRNFNNGCVIHIRGGDFVELGWNSINSIQFFKKSVLFMKENYEINHFCVVTDDVIYSNSVLENLDIKFEFVNSNELDDFNLIGGFQKRILSSSTFAFWASSLGLNSDSVVITSDYWSPGRKKSIKLPNQIDLA